MESTLFSGATPLLLFIAKATLLLVAALAAAATLRRSTAGARHLVWLAALVGVLALPVLARIPALQIGVLPSGLVTRGVANGEGRMANGEEPPVVLSSSAPALRSSTPATARPSRFAIREDAAPSLSTFQILGIAWAAVSAGLLGWLIFGAIQVRRIVVNATELTSPDWTMPLCEVADRLDLEQAPRLVISDRIEMAFACRALSPTIVLPSTAESWADDRRRAVLFHELAHVKRHDLVSHTLGRVACALYWFHPLVWTAAKRLRSESEMACDDLVLSCGARASDYAQHLLDMVTGVRKHGAPVMALPMARKKEFEGRMLAILDPAIRRASPGRVQAATVVATLGALSLTVAAVGPASARQTPAVTPPPIAQQQADTTRKHRSEDTLRKTVRQETRTVINETMNTVTSSSGISASMTPTEVHAINELSKNAAVFGTGIASQVLRGLGLNTNSNVQARDTARVALLIKVLNTDNDAGVRRAAAWALNEVPTPAARTALIHALETDGDDQVREMSAWALAEAPTDAAAGALANALVKDKSTQVRRTAAWALGSLEKRQYADVLTSAVSDADPEVRQVALWALGQLEVRPAPTVVINALSDNSPQVRQTAAWTLGQMEDSSAVRPLARAFETETDASAKRTYLWALSQIGTVPTNVLESAMKSSDPDIRRHAVALLSGNADSWPWPWPWPWPRPNP